MQPTRSRPYTLLVGESPPAGAPPDFKPFDCASGDNLARHLGLVGRGAVLSHIDRDNIFHEPGVGIVEGRPWIADDAKDNGDNLIAAEAAGIGQNSGAVTIIALGAKTAAALGVGFLPWYTWRRALSGVYVMPCPHPSGRSSTLATADARRAMRRVLLPDIITGSHSLRAWHFKDDPEVLADLGAAICPHHPGAGMLAAQVAAEFWRLPLDTAAAKADGLRATVDRIEAVSFFELAQRLGESPTAHTIRDVFALSKRSDIAGRIKMAARHPALDGYPADVLRATIGRYYATGVLS